MGTIVYEMLVRLHSNLSSGSSGTSDDPKLKKNAVLSLSNIGG